MALDIRLSNGLLLSKDRNPCLPALMKSPGLSKFLTSIISNNIHQECLANETWKEAIKIKLKRKLLIFTKKLKLLKKCYTDQWVKVWSNGYGSLLFYSGYWSNHSEGDESRSKSCQWPVKETSPDPNHVNNLPKYRNEAPWCCKYWF